MENLLFRPLLTHDLMFNLDNIDATFKPKYNFSTLWFYRWFTKHSAEKKDLYHWLNTPNPELGLTPLENLSGELLFCPDTHCRWSWWSKLKKNHFPKSLGSGGRKICRRLLIGFLAISSQSFKMKFSPFSFS